MVGSACFISKSNKPGAGKLRRACRRRAFCAAASDGTQPSYTTLGGGKRDLRIPEGAVIVGFVGCLTQDRTGDVLLQVLRLGRGKHRPDGKRRPAVAVVGRHNAKIVSSLHPWAYQ